MRHSSPRTKRFDSHSGLPAADRVALEDKLTPPNRVITLSSLFRRLDRTADGFYDMSTLIIGNASAADAYLNSTAAASQPDGSSAVHAVTKIRTIHEYLASWLKVWVWAVPDVARAVFLGCDILVRASLDSLFNRT